jgi:23S rRNA G2445 N2-methylase RlmL
MFVSAVAGLGPLVSDELTHIDGVRVIDSGFDGRGDVVLLDVQRGAIKRLLHADTVEDVFAEVAYGQLAAGESSASVARSLWRRRQVDSAMGIWAGVARDRSRNVSYRVVVRTLGERLFRRTDLRRELQSTIRHDRPQWRPADPAQLEVWAVEYRTGRLVSGLRLSSPAMRQHGGRAVNRAGALRPTVAAAMVRLAGAPSGTLVDPCCGSGTILGEAIRAGWTARGFDIDPDAVSAAVRNESLAGVVTGDARGLDLPEASVAACVSNLPFGRRFTVDGERSAWLRAVLAEMVRVTRPGGRVVVLAPTIPASSLPPSLRLHRAVRIRLLGTWAGIHAYVRA